MLNLTAFQFFPLLSMVFMLTLGIFILNSKRDFLGWLFFMITAVFAIWTFGTFMMFLNQGDEDIIFWDRLIYFGVVFMPALQYHFSLLSTYYTKKRKILLVIAYVFSFIFLVLSRTGYFVNDIFRYRWGVHTVAHIAHHFFMLFFFFYIFALLYNIYIQYRNTEIKVEKYKLALSAAAFAILNIVGGLGFLPAYKISIYSPISLLAPLAFTIMITYTILKYRFMDMRVAIKKSFVYISLTFFTFVSFSILVQYSDFFLRGDNFKETYLIFFAASVMFTIAFFLFEKILSKISNKYFFAGLYNYQETIRTLSRELTYNNNLKEIVTSIVDTIKKSFQLESAGIVLIIRNKKSVSCEAAKLSGFSSKNSLFLAKDNILVKHLRETRVPLVSDELALLARDAKTKAEKSGFENLYKKMFQVKASVCLPLINENNLIGIIILGAKLSGGVYTNDDLELLSVLSNQAGIAINNALLYKKIKDFNKILQEKVDEQTHEIKKEALELEEKNKRLKELLSVKNDFLRVVNHQLNTPVSIIKNSIFMMKSGSFNQEQGLEYIEESTNRMSDIFSDFWRAFAFEGEGVKLDLEKVDIRKIVAELAEDASNMPTAKKKNLEIKIENNGPVPLVKTDPKQITQAVSNLLENAISYTKSGSIIFSFVKFSDSRLKVLITDTGCGIDDEDQKKIFEKFTRGRRATQVRPGGSGLGLYITKRIVEAGGGELKLEKSEPDKGTTFSFTVPTWRES